MRFLRGIGAISLAAATLAALLAGGGCSCKKSQPPPNVVVQPAAAPAPAAVPAAAAAPAPAAQQAQASKPYLPGPAAPGVGESVLRGPGDYLGTVAVTAPRYARKQIDLSYLTNEINQYQASEGHYPASLKDLETWRGEPLPPPPAGGKYSYDPKTGKLDMVAAD